MTQPTGVRSRPDGPFDLGAQTSSIFGRSCSNMSAEGSLGIQPTGVRSRTDGPLGAQPTDGPLGPVQTCQLPSQLTKTRNLGPVQT